MKTRNVLLIALISMILPQLSLAQSGGRLTQNICGIVTDAASGQPMPYVAVALSDTAAGTVTCEDGAFVLRNVPVGRHTVQVSFMGYETAVLKEILVGSAKEVWLEVGLTEKPMELDKVVVWPKIDKAGSLNTMAALGVQMFSVEEAGRFAGGMDDPARLAANYAGVAANAANNNGISIHGNAPSLLQWRLEGVEIPNPNHFADVTALGGGFMSGLSSNVLGNFDFFVGAFPAEYGNAVSGVFDMRLRNGNNQKYQHTFQLGVLGTDFASEGPISRKHGSSYIVNYRFSTSSLVEKLMGMTESIGFQDLNFKLNFPTRNAGIFSLWGLGLLDRINSTLEEPSEWKYIDDGLLSAARQTSGATGLSHKYLFGNGRTSLHTTLAATIGNSHIYEDIYDTDKNHKPRTDMTSGTTNLVFTSALGHKFGARHTNKTGVTMTHIRYDMALDFASLFGDPLENYIRTNESTNLLSIYSTSNIRIGNDLTLTAGVSAQYLALNGATSVEPRIGLEWQLSPKSSFALGYGLHSRMEKPDVYFVRDADGDQPNRSLGFTKSHHLMLSYNLRISENMNLKVEPYYQYLYGVPVAENGAYSILNRDLYYITEILTGKGLGRNYGVDFTLEKYLNGGFYWMATASLYRSTYCGGDGVWHDTRYNRGFIVNGLVGKEWMLRNNVLGVNLKVGVMGGERYTPVNEAATLAHPDKEVQYDESRMYSMQFSPQYIGDFSISYRINRRRVAHEFAVKSVNATGQKTYLGHKYNIHTGRIEPRMMATFMFNVSYRIEF